MRKPEVNDVLRLFVSDLQEPVSTGRVSRIRGTLVFLDDNPIPFDCDSLRYHWKFVWQNIAVTVKNSGGAVSRLVVSQLDFHKRIHITETGLYWGVYKLPILSVSFPVDEPLV